MELVISLSPPEGFTFQISQ